MLTGGVDKTLALFNLDSEEIESTFKGHRKQITSCILHPDKKTVISSSSDTQIRIWTKGVESARQIIGIHTSPVSEISLHPTGDYVLSFSDDTYWSLIDLNVGRPIVKNRGDKEIQPFSCGQCHPDGLIFGTGTREAMVKIWDLREQANVANFPGHQVCLFISLTSRYFRARFGPSASPKMVITWPVVVPKERLKSGICANWPMFVPFQSEMETLQ